MGMPVSDATSSGVLPTAFNCWIWAICCAVNVPPCTVGAEGVVVVNAPAGAVSAGVAVVCGVSPGSPASKWNV